MAKTGVTYNGVRISFEQPVGANLGTIKIFGAIFDKNCAGTITCNQTFNLNMPNFPVVIQAERTGIFGVASVLGGVKDAYNVVSASTTDFAVLSNIAGAGTTTALSVVNAIDTYPAGSFAGFTIAKNDFAISANLFPSLTIRTYLDGVAQESQTGNSLIDLAVLVQIFGTPSSFYNAGFITTKPFDEIRIEVGTLVGLLDDFLNVYGAFIDTRTATGGALLCFNTNPDNNVTFKGVLVNGNVNSNDNVASGTTYGTPVADGVNPGPELPVMAANGSYTFLTNTPGIYSFNVPVCIPGTVPCFTEALTITVLDKDIDTNPPVANDDVAVVKGSPTGPATSVTVDVAANDGPGNPGGTLGSPTITTPAAANGSAIIVGDKVVYTPAVGFYGEDIVTYQICESPSGLCTKAELVVTVLRPEAPNTLSASDDYMSTPKNKTLVVSAADGVLANDTDPDGDPLTVTLADLDITGGHLLLNADGSYTFTPTANYTGPSSYVYTVCDNQGNCKQATLYLLVQSIPNLDPIIPIDDLNFSAAGAGMERDFLVTLTEKLGSPTDETPVSFRVSRLSAFDITVPGITLNGTDQSGISGNSAVNGSTPNTNGNWMFRQDDNFIIVTSKPIVDFAGNEAINIGFHVKRKASIAVNTTQNITVTIVAGSGGEIDFTDNTSIIKIKAN